MRKVSITVDVERDCPPKLQTFLGIKRGLPKLLELFRREEIPATFCYWGNCRVFPFDD